MFEAFEPVRNLRIVINGARSHQNAGELEGVTVVNTGSSDRLIR